LKEAIVLCGGQSYRLKPQIQIPKPLLPIGSLSLLEIQLLWLKYSGKFDHVVLATNTSLPIKDYIQENILIDQVIEKDKLGTSGAVRNAVNYVTENQVYIMNVDDIVFYNPDDLFSRNIEGACILLSKPRLSFGRVIPKNHYKVAYFEEKPYLNILVSAGHYVFDIDLIYNFFPRKGDLERRVLPELCSRNILTYYLTDKRWFTVNNYKQYLELLDYLT